MNLQFIDYLHNARIQDKLVYYKAFHDDRLDMRILSFTFKIIKKTIKTLFKP